MKKALLLICALIFTFTLTGCVPPAPAPDSSATYGKLEYKEVLENGQTIGYEVTGIGTYSGSDVLIPESYGDKPVIGVGDGAFFGNTRLRSIDMFSSVTYIGDNAFSGCANLSTIGLSKNITEIGSGCFYGCNMLSYNVYGNGNYLGNDANPYMVFVSFAKEGEIKFNENTKLIYGSAFAGSKIESINITKNIINFSGYDFRKCEKLTSVTVDEGNGVYRSENNSVIRSADNALVYTLDSADLSNLRVEKICSYAFSNWNNTDPISLPEGITEIEDNAFAYAKFGAINFPATLTKIGMGIFYSCDNLSSIGDFVAENYYCVGNCIIDVKEKSVLAGCKTSLIPESSQVTKIDKSAFFCCNGLTEITIPENIVKIDDMAFYLCGALEKVNLPSDLKVIGENAFSLCLSLKNLTLNEGVYKIGKRAFSSSGLESITIPKSMLYIEEGAFANCKSLKTVYFLFTEDKLSDIAVYGGNEPFLNAEKVFQN